MAILEVTAKQEASEAEPVEERTADLKKELEDVKEQLETLIDARKRQEVMVKNIICHWDMYKSMAWLKTSKRVQKKILKLRFEASLSLLEIFYLKDKMSDT